MTEKTSLRTSPSRGRKILSMVLIGLVLPVIAFVVSVCVGRYPIALRDLAGYLLKPGVTDVPGANIFWNIRLPRVLFSLLAGGAISVSGAVLQGVYRNPLVSPDIIGVSSGASLGAAIAIVLFSTASANVPLFAFVGGLITVSITFNLARFGKQNTVVSLVLAGIIIDALAKSGVSILKYIADPMQQLPMLEFWLMGTLNAITWDKLFRFIPMLAVGVAVIFFLRWQLNALSMGDEEAASLGLHVMLIRGLMIGASTLLVAGIISVTGKVEWVGLICPHITRILVGSDHKISIPMSFCSGAVFLALADTIARSVSSAELPISVVTALVGAPFLAFLLIRYEKTPWQ